MPNPAFRDAFGLHVREDRGVGDRLDEPGAKDRRRDAENDVRISAMGGEWISGRLEVGLGDVATRGVTATGDDEEVVHTAIVGSVRIPLKACFTDGTILRDEPRHHVFCTIESGNPDQGVPRGARSTGSRLRMARQALVGVEARPKPIVVASCHDLDLSEPGESVFKERTFVRSKALQRTASACRTGAHPRICGHFHRLSRRANARRCQNCGNECAELLQQLSVALS